MEVWWLWVVTCKFARCDVMVQRPRWRQCGGSSARTHESTGELRGDWQVGCRYGDVSMGFGMVKNACAKHAYLVLRVCIR